MTVQDKVEPMGAPKAETSTPMGTMGTPRNDAAAQAKAKGLTLATERVYLNSKGEKVGEDDPDKVTLLAAKGQPVPSDETIKAMGFKTQAERDAKQEPKPADANAENAKTQGRGTKAKGKGEDKSAKGDGDK